MASITVRVPDDLKKEIDALGVQVSEVTRTALENEVRKLKRMKAEEAAEKLGRLLAKVPDEEIVKAVRDSRDQR
jgi:post-segregation antitoxin (ccd killing protein)